MSSSYAQQEDIYQAFMECSQLQNENDELKAQIAKLEAENQRLLKDPDAVSDDSNAFFMSCEISSLLTWEEFVEANDTDIDGFFKERNLLFGLRIKLKHMRKIELKKRLRA